jgi:hypothetical protein
VAGFVLLRALVAEALEYRVPPALVVLLAIPLLTTVSTVALLAFCGGAWSHKSWPGGERAHYTTVTLAALVWIALLHYWNLLGFRY